MIQLDNDLISGLEKLTRLQLGAVEREKLTTELRSMLEMVDQLQALDTTGVEPLIYLNETEQTLRDDNVGEHLTSAQALQNAPQQDGRFFRVAKVVNP